MPDGNTLVASVGEDLLGRGQLWSIDYPGGEMHRFSNDLSDYTVDLDLTRDGKVLAGIQHTRLADVWIAPSSDATQARQLTSGGTTYERVAPGPAGKLLLRSGNGDLWLMSADGGGQPMLAVPQAHNLGSASSCADRYIVFDSYRDSTIQLWRAEADGSNGLKLLDETGGSDCSPDGKWIIYVAERHLYRLPLEGGTPSEVLVPAPAEGVSLPRISPDGNLVAVRYQEGSPVPVSKLGVVPASGGSRRFVGQLPIGSAGLHWSPDGRGLQYLLTRSGATNVWEQPLTGGDPHQVTKFATGRIFSFAWSRDGKQLLLSKGNESSDVILISNFR